MSKTEEGALSPAVGAAIEIGIRLGVIALLVVGCVAIMAPFLGIAIWALILATAADGPFEVFCRWMGGRRKLAAFVGVAATLLILIVPTVMLSETLISGAYQMSEGGFAIPEPHPGVESWPVVGPQLFKLWHQASDNIGDALVRIQPQLEAVARWLLSAAGSVGAGVLQLLASILIAGVLLVRGEMRRAGTERLAVRLAGETRGPELSRLATGTIRSVVQGIVGVAVIQAILSGAGFMVAGIPAAGLWALLVLVAAVVQLPVTLVVIPPILIAYSTMGGVPATILAVWAVVISLLDNILKPILFGRGVEVPSLVIFMGALGGMLTMGIVGLFLGSVVLAVGFALFRAWLFLPDAAPGAATST